MEFDHELHAYKDLLVTISPDLTPGETEQIKIIGRSTHENIPFIINKKFLYTNDSDKFHIYNSLMKKIEVLSCMFAGYYIVLAKEFLLDGIKAWITAGSSTLFKSTRGWASIDTVRY